MHFRVALSLGARELGNARAAPGQLIRLPVAVRTEPCDVGQRLDKTTSFELNVRIMDRPRARLAP